MFKGLIVSIIAGFQIMVLFVVGFIIFSALQQSPLGQTPASAAVISQGQQSLSNLWDWYSIADTIEFLGVMVVIIGGFVWFVLWLFDNSQNSYYY